MSREKGVLEEYLVAFCNKNLGPEAMEKFEDIISRIRSEAKEVRMQIYNALERMWAGSYNPRDGGLTQTAYERELSTFSERVLYPKVGPSESGMSANQASLVEALA